MVVEGGTPVTFQYFIKRPSECVYGKQRRINGGIGEINIIDVFIGLYIVKSIGHRKLHGIVG
jgi:hypothetical protein